MVPCNLEKPLFVADIAECNFPWQICAIFIPVLLLLQLCESVGAHVVTINASDLDLDPDSIGSVDPDQGRQIRPAKK